MYWERQANTMLVSHLHFLCDNRKKQKEKNKQQHPQPPPPRRPTTQQSWPGGKMKMQWGPVPEVCWMLNPMVWLCTLTSSLVSLTDKSCIRSERAWMVSAASEVFRLVSSTFADCRAVYSAINDQLLDTLHTHWSLCTQPSTYNKSVSVGIWFLYLHA